MRTQSTDTDPVVEQLQVARLRRLTPDQRFQMANSLTRSAFAMSWNNFRRKHADLDEDSAALLWVRLLYGDELADRLAAYLRQDPAR